MAKPKVLATRPLFPAAQQILNATCEVDYWTQPERISKEELFSTTSLFRIAPSAEWRRRTRPECWTKPPRISRGRC